MAGEIRGLVVHVRRIGSKKAAQILGRWKHSPPSRLLASKADARAGEDYQTLSWGMGSIRISGVHASAKLPKDASIFVDDSFVIRSC